VDRRERERILGEHQPRQASAIERRQAERLAQDLAGSPVAGKPLPRRLRNFSHSADRYAVSLAGPPAYSSRLREIEDEIATHERALQSAWDDLAADHGDDPAIFAQRWRALAGRWRFDAVNDLIEKHNDYYPIEARLAMDPKTRDFVLVGGAPYRRQPLDAEWVLGRFPVELEAAA
jgi:hypothetical protein